MEGALASGFAIAQLHHSAGHDRRTLGGVLIGVGALLFPGGNERVLLIGFPVGAWQAMLAYFLLVATLTALITKFGSSAVLVWISRMGKTA